MWITKTEGWTIVDVNDDECWTLDDVERNVRDYNNDRKIKAPLMKQKITKQEKKKKMPKKIQQTAKRRIKTREPKTKQRKCDVASNQEKPSLSLNELQTKGDDKMTDYICDQYLYNAKDCEENQTEFGSPGRKHSKK